MKTWSESAAVMVCSNVCRGWRASWDTLFLDQDSPGGAPTMPATDQWAVSMLIREVLADPDLAGRGSSGVCSGPGRGSGPPP